MRYRKVADKPRERSLTSTACVEITKAQRRLRLALALFYMAQENGDIDAVKKNGADLEVLTAMHALDNALALFPVKGGKRS